MAKKTNNSLPPNGDEPTEYPLGARIAELVEAIGSRSEAAAIAGVSTQQLRNLISGRNAPSLLSIAELARASGYRLDWVVSGEGDPKAKAEAQPAPRAILDPNLLARLFDALTKVYREAGVSLPAAELGRMAGIEYQDVAEVAVTEDEQIAMARLVAQKHRRALADEKESPRVRKRGA